MFQALPGMTQSPYSLVGGAYYDTLPGNNLATLDIKRGILPNGLGCPGQSGMGDIHSALASFGGSAIGGLLFAVVGFTIINNLFSDDAKKARGRRKLDRLNREYEYKSGLISSKYKLDDDDKAYKVTRGAGGRFTKVPV